MKLSKRYTYWNHWILWVFQIRARDLLEQHAPAHQLLSVAVHLRSKLTDVNFSKLTDVHHTLSVSTSEQSARRSLPVQGTWYSQAAQKLVQG